jgi:hypothetical protein
MNSEPSAEMERTNPVPRGVSLLRSFARKREAVEHCELCAAELSREHQHLLDPVRRKVICSCGACSILFSSRGETKYKRVPRLVRYLPDFRMSDAQWDSLMIPINMAFFFESTPESKTVALYPSPGGPIESMLSLDSWNDIVRDNPALSAMERDVEALLVNRIAQSRGAGAGEYFVAPIDECYKLVGLIRGSWRGFSGGTEVWREIGKFFAGLKEKSCRT